jgi:hypothetical protein
MKFLLASSATALLAAVPGAAFVPSARFGVPSSSGE